MDPKKERREDEDDHESEEKDHQHQDEEANAKATKPALRRNVNALQDDDHLAGPPRRSALEDEDEFQFRSASLAVMSAAVPTLQRPLMHHMGPNLNVGGFSMGPPAFGKSQKSAAPKKNEHAAASFVGPRADRTNYVGVVPRALPPPPFRLEMHTHFHVKNEPIQRVCSVVGVKLCELDTDFVFKADKCKWKVEFRRANSVERVEMNIVIFKAGKEYVVEAQRREGDITALMFLYNELKMFFKRNQMLSEKEKVMTGVKRPAPESKPTVSVVHANVREAVASIKGLLESKFADVQMQGVLAAISLSTSEDAKADMPSLVPLLVTLGQSKNENVSKLVRVALARLCNHSVCRQALVRSDGWHFIVKCAAGGADVKPEVQRDSLRVVECLCSLYSDELAQVEGADKVLELIQRWEGIEDPRLKKHACNAHRALKEAGVIA